MMFPNNGCFFVWLPNPTADLAGKFSRQSAPQKSTPGGVEAQKKTRSMAGFQSFNRSIFDQADLCKLLAWANSTSQARVILAVLFVP